MCRYGLAYHVCNRILHTALHILTMCREPFVLFTVSCRAAARLIIPQIQACRPLTAQPIPNGVNSTPPQSGPDNCCLLQSRSAHTKKAHNRTLGTGLNVLNKLMKSAHRTQAGHDKNLYSCETRPSWEGFSSICLFICLFDSPRRSARGTGGPTKVRCQRGVYKIEQSRARERDWKKQEWERVKERERERERERLRAGSVGGWVGGFGNAEWTSCVLLLVKQKIWVLQRLCPFTE